MLILNQLFLQPLYNDLLNGNVNTEVEIKAHPFKKFAEIPSGPIAINKCMFYKEIMSVCFISIKLT